MRRRAIIRSQLISWKFSILRFVGTVAKLNLTPLKYGGDEEGVLHYVVLDWSEMCFCRSNNCNCVKIEDGSVLF